MRAEDALAVQVLGLLPLMQSLRTAPSSDGTRMHAMVLAGSGGRRHDAFSIGASLERDDYAIPITDLARLGPQVFGPPRPLHDPQMVADRADAFFSSGTSNLTNSFPPPFLADDDCGRG